MNIDGNSNVHPISKYIYGVSAGNEAYVQSMGVSVVRWGGNQTTRSNWENNSSNSGHDWGLCDGRWSNVNQANGSTVPGKASVDFVQGNKAIGADTLISIPMLGWVAKDGNNSNCSTGVPSQGGFPVSPGSEAIAGYDPTANRNGTSIPSLPKKGSAFSYPPNTTDNVVYQDEWVDYLKNQFGDANSGGVRFYSMDNEYDLWDSTHRDIHPTYSTYDELWTKFRNTAEAVKEVDPAVQITGPVGWGPMSFLNSQNGWQGGGDRVNHGNLPLYQWFLRQAKNYETQNGRKLLDILSIHYYPQGPRTPGVGQVQFPGATDATTNAYRLRSIRSLWDPNYDEESWMSDLEFGSHIRYIPRLKEVIASEYPGTKLALTEFNWGAENHINGGLAVAELLGVFGREGLDIATYWTVPPNNSPAYFAYRMYRNVDGNFTGFGDTSIRVTQDSVDVDKFSIYASKDSVTNETKLMLINKDPQNQQTVTLNLANITGGGAAKVYQYSKNDTSRIVQLPNLANLSRSVQYPMPSYSITLLILDPNVAPSDGSTVITPAPTPTPPPLNSTPAYVYNDALSSSWENWSYNNASVNFSSTTQVRSGNNSIAWTGNAWAGLYLHSGTGINTTGYNTLHFALFGTNTSNSYNLSLHDTSSNQIGSIKIEDFGGPPTAGAWKVYDIPLPAFGVNSGQVVGEFQLFSNAGVNQQVVYVDEIRLVGVGSKVGDMNGDGVVGIADLSALLSKWGTTDVSANLDNIGSVGIADLSIMLSNWG